MGKMKYIVSFCAVGLCALLPMVHADAKEVKVSDGTALQNAIANCRKWRYYYTRAMISH